MLSSARFRDTRVLIVEDDALCRDTVRTLLSVEGARVTTAESAEAGVEALKTETFDAIVADIRLPGMDGIAFLKHVRKQNADIPVIIMTGFSSISSAVEALKRGAHDYLVKPFSDPKQLPNSVWKAIEHARLAARSRLLQEQLQEREETLSTLFHNASDAIFLHGLGGRREVGRCMEANKVALRRLGYSREDISSLSLLDLVVPERRTLARQVLGELFQSGHATFETVFIARNEDRIPVEINAHLFTFRNRKVVLSIARNIADRLDTERRVIEASEAECRRIGQELHDVLCQDLVSIDVLSSVVQKTLDSEPSKARADVDIIRDMAAQMLSRLRCLCVGLFPVELDSDLVGALEQMAHHQERLFKIPCSFRVEGEIPALEKSRVHHLYRIAQQGVNNAAVHSKAKRIWIALVKRPVGCVLQVEDDGTGIRTESRRTDGLGLSIMKYRARLIGAILIISAREGGGTRIECSWS